MNGLSFKKLLYCIFGNTGFYSSILWLGILLTGGNASAENDSGGPAEEEKPKVLYVNFYHSGYEWSDNIAYAILKEFRVTRHADGTLDASRSPVNLKIIEMDTKRNASESHLRHSGLEVKSYIES